MNHYVLLFHFDDQNSQNHFEERIRQHFGRHKVERNGDTTYFGFAGQEEPGVVGQIKSSIDTLGIGSADYVALYFSKQEEGPEKITQKMLLGSDDLVETNIRTVSNDAHVNTISSLLDFDYVKAQPEPPN
jgi:hypothetical protein